MFDSSGTALQDVAAAIAVYERARVLVPSSTSWKSDAGFPGGSTASPWP